MDFIRVKTKRRTASQWYELVKLWLSSDKSQSDFCKQQGIHCAKTFSRWVCDYRNFFNLPETDNKPAKKVITPVVAKQSISNSQAPKPSAERVAQLCVGELCVKVPLSATESEWQVIFSSLRAGS